MFCGGGRWCFVVVVFSCGVRVVVFLWWCGFLLRKVLLLNVVINISRVLLK